MPRKITPWMLREFIIYLLFFYLILGFPTAVFELLSRGQPFQSTPKFLVGFKPGSFRFSVQHRKPPGLFSESLCRKQFTLTIFSFSCQFLKMHSCQYYEFAIFYLQQIIHRKFYSLIPLKRNSPFMRYLFMGYQLGK